MSDELKEVNEFASEYYKEVISPVVKRLLEEGEKLKQKEMKDKIIIAKPKCKSKSEVMNNYIEGIILKELNDIEQKFETEYDYILLELNRKRYRRPKRYLPILRELFFKVLKIKNVVLVENLKEEK